MKLKTNQMISIEREKYQAYLTKEGLRLTTGRKIVFEEAIKAHGHFAPEELLKQCRCNKRQVSRATVYRGIHELMEAGIIRKTAFGEKHQHFEHIYDEQPHHHARCVRCGYIMEFPDLEEDEVYKPILEKKGFKILGHEMHFYGICQSCAGG